MSEQWHETSPIDPVPLEHIVDDFDAERTAMDWAVDEMAKGHTAEEVADELVANGWDEDAAAEMAESARRATRHLRGAITREQVAGEYSGRYRKATALRWFSVFPNVSSLWRLLNSLGGLRKTKKNPK